MLRITIYGSDESNDENWDGCNWHNVDWCNSVSCTSLVEENPKLDRRPDNENKSESGEERENERKVKWKWSIMKVKDREIESGC